MSSGAALAFATILSHLFNLREADIGYEIVVPKRNASDSRKTMNRRYTNVYYLEDRGWRIVAPQATNVSVK
ncbi:MAG TPA: hypothetical protein VGI36_04705 [Candidatus Binataceae bacterium]|jgi:hypothetical protein